MDGGDNCGKQRIVSILMDEERPLEENGRIRSFCEWVLMMRK